MTTSVKNISGASREVHLPDGSTVVVANNASYGFPDSVAGHVPSLPGDVGAGLLQQTTVWQPSASVTNVSLVVQMNGNTSLTVRVTGAAFFSDSGRTTPVSFPQTITSDTTFYSTAYGVEPLTVSLKDSLGYEHWLSGIANLDAANPTTTVQAAAPLGSGNFLALPSGSPTSGQVPIATGTGTATAWGSAGGIAKLYDPKASYGATYDGTTDDSAAIQAAIDAASAAGGGIVEVRNVNNSGNTAGTRIKINSSLVLKDSVWLRGMGSATVLTGNASPMIKLPTSGSLVDRMMVSDLFLQSPVGRGIQLDTTGETGGWQLGWPRVTIQNVTVTDAGGASFYAPAAGGPIETRYINCVSIRATGHGFDIGSTDTHFIGCTAGQGSAYGFNIAGGNSKFSVCKAYGNTQGNWQIGGAGRHMLASCESQDSGAYGFNVQSGNNALSACLADTDKYAGFYLAAGSNSLTSCTAIYGGGGSGQTTAIGYLFGFGVRGCNVSGWTSCSVPVGGDVTGNNIDVNGGTAQQKVAYAATITPAPYTGEFVDVAPLTGNVTIANPTRYHIGQRLRIRLRQDATGSRTVTWGSLFQVATALASTANASTIFTFVYDGAHFVEQVAGVSSPATLALATFTAADSASSVPNADSPSVAWTNSAGATFGVSSNQLYISAGSGQSRYYGFYDFGASDGLLTVTLGGTLSSVYGLVFRYVDANNYMSMRNDGIYEMVAGSERNLAPNGAGWTVGDVMGVYMSGPSVVAYKNGSPIQAGVMGVATGTGVAVAPSSTLLAGTKHGVWLQSALTAIRFDNLTLIA